MKCSQCGSAVFEEDHTRGDKVCAECGLVVEENEVQAFVEYVENAGGTAAALGNFVSLESQMPGYRESRHVTEQKARKRIDIICGQLRLGAGISASAFSYYQTAHFRGFTRGRSSLQLAAACIYIAARQQRVNLMLLDLSDATAVNVYNVGRTYVDLKRKLNLALPEVDPCLFVERFASQLDFEDKTTLVATTAMRLLQRMKKDWISTGRRPSGLAAAALLVAARIHEFNRTEEDVAKVARISQMTTRKRLMEFSKTPSSALSIDDFFTVDYDEEQDPPCFGQPTQKRRLRIPKMRGNPKGDKRVRSMIDWNEWSTDLKDLDMEQVSAEIKELGRRIDQKLEDISNKRKSGVTVNDPELAKSKGLKHLVETDSPLAKDLDSSLNIENEAADISIVEDIDVVECSSSSISGSKRSVSEASSSVIGEKRAKSSRQVLRDVLDGVVDPEILDSCVEDLELITAHSGSQLCELVRATQQIRNERDAMTETNADIDAKQEMMTPSSTYSFQKPSHSFPPNYATDESYKLPHFLTPLTPAEGCLGHYTANSSADTEETKVAYSIDLSDIDDEELDREYFLKPREVMVKATLWMKDNGAFLEEQRRKRAERQRLKEEQAKQPKKPRRNQRKIYQRQRRMPWHASSKNDNQDDDEGGDNIQIHRVSKKINYAALDAIVGAGPSATAPSSPTAPTPFAIEDENSNSTNGPLVLNPLLEKSIAATAGLQQKKADAVDSTSRARGGLPGSVSSPALLQNLPEEEIDEEEPLETPEEYEDEEEEDEEEIDWTEGNDLW
ncbi:hypothetical protein ACTXT7_002262 [Hymenolepis weldensis]